jgi:hypothetical protein
LIELLFDIYTLKVKVWFQNRRMKWKRARGVSFAKVEKLKPKASAANGNGSSYAINSTSSIAAAANGTTSSGLPFLVGYNLPNIHDMSSYGLNQMQPIGSNANCALNNSVGGHFVDYYSQNGSGGVAYNDEDEDDDDDNDDDDDDEEDDEDDDNDANGDESSTEDEDQNQANEIAQNQQEFTHHHGQTNHLNTAQQNNSNNNSHHQHLNHQHHQIQTIHSSTLSHAHHQHHNYSSDNSNQLKEESSAVSAAHLIKFKQDMSNANSNRVKN